MPWEWEYDSPNKRWVLTLGEWRAVVQRIDPQHVWQSYVERIADPDDQHDGPVDKDPMRARAWCLTTIARLRTSGKDGT
jgi:hypothetical protein